MFALIFQQGLVICTAVGVESAVQRFRQLRLIGQRNQVLQGRFNSAEDPPALACRPNLGRKRSEEFFRSSAEAHLDDYIAPDQLALAETISSPSSST